MGRASLLNLVDRVHQAASQSNWQGLLGALSDAFDGTAVAVVPELRDAGFSPLYGAPLSTGIPEDRRAPASPIIDRLWHMPRNNISVVQRFDDPSWPEMCAFSSKYFSDGIFYRTMHALLEHAGSPGTLFGIARSRGKPQFTAQDIALMEAILPHIATVATVFNSTSRGLFDPEDNLGYATFYLDRSSVPVGLNGVARRMLIAGDVVRISHARLELVSNPGALRTAMGAASSGALERRTVSLSVASESGLLHSATLSAPAFGIPNGGVAKLMIDDPVSFARIDREALYRQYGLTGAESRLPDRRDARFAASRSAMRSTDDDRLPRRWHSGITMGSRCNSWCRRNSGPPPSPPLARSGPPNC